MPRHYSAELRRRACERMLAGEAVKDLVDELDVTMETLYRWRRQALIDAGQRPGAKSFEADPLAQARRRIKELEAELEMVKAAARIYDELEAADPKRKFQVVRRLNNLGYTEKKACHVVGLSRSTYYKMKFRHPSDAEIRRLLLADSIADIYERSRRTYGMLRIRAALEIEQGLIVNKKLVWKIMREPNIKGLPGPKKGVKNLKNAPTCEDLVQRAFVAKGPNELWLTDITEHPTAEGKIYCCVVLDLFSRKVVGWAIDRRCESALVIDAITKAKDSRPRSASTIIHSDHGSQFTSWAFTENVRRLGLISSMGTVGDCFDNAPMESFWGSMQIELFNRQRWRTNLQLSVGIADYIENFYNVARRHSALNYLTPIEFEDLHSTHIHQAALS